MRKLLVSTAAIALFAAPVFAQTAPALTAAQQNQLVILQDQAAVAVARQAQDAAQAALQAARDAQAVAAAQAAVTALQAQ